MINYNYFFIRKDTFMDRIKNFFKDLDLKDLLSRINFHIVFLCMVLVIMATIFLRLYNWNSNSKVLDTTEDTSGAFDRETLDSLVPYTYDAEPKDPEDLVIACFGNAPFADNRGQEDNLANIIAERTNATVYNFGFPDSYLSSETVSILGKNNDLFSLYWLTTIFAVDNDVIVDYYLNDAPDTPIEIRATLSLLQNLDFNTVDVIAIMYDGSDYLDGRGMYNSHDSTNIHHFGGALEASIELIHEKFPHIHVIVMSPPYAYALNEDGSYADSTITTFGEGPLASYVQYESNVCYKMFSSFVDTFYGSLSELDSDVVLRDHIHLSSEGRQRAADEFMEAYEYYLKFRTK